MNNVDINQIKEFRRFVNTYIYPKTAHILVCDIKDVCDADTITYEYLPQSTVKFHTNITTQEDLTILLYGIIKTVFTAFYNKPDVISFIKSQIHTQVIDENLKASLRSTFQEIQYGNPQYLGLLFNITCLADNYIYLYL